MYIAQLMSWRLGSIERCSLQARLYLAKMQPYHFNMTHSQWGESYFKDLALPLQWNVDVCLCLDGLGRGFSNLGGFCDEKRTVSRDRDSCYWM